MTTSTPQKSYLQDKKLNKIEQNKAQKDGLNISLDLNKFAAMGWEEMDETDLKLRLKWFGMFWRPKTPGKFMMRLRIPNGILQANQLKVISSIVNRYEETGNCDITTRQNLQLRGILLGDLPEIIRRLKSVNLYTIQSGFDNPRNITGNPLAGIDPEEIIDTRKYTNDLDSYFTNNGEGNYDFSNLPRKWNVAVAGSKDNFLLHNDLIFHPVKKGNIDGFSIWVGGVLSSVMNKYAIPLNAWIPEEDICHIAGIICKIWRNNGERNIRQKGRFRFYLDAIGIEEFRKKVEKEYGSLHKDPGSEFNQNQRNHFGIHSQKQIGFHYAGIHVPVGRLAAEDLQDLAQLAEKYGSGEIRLTEDQNIIISGIKTKQLETFSSEILSSQFSINPEKIISGTVACTGKTYCSFANANTKDQALKVAKELDKELDISQDIKIHWTGCPNSCGQAFMGEIGLTGTKIRNTAGEIVEAFNITLGGNQGEKPKLGSLYQKAVPTYELKDVIKKILIMDYGAKPKSINKTDQQISFIAA